MKILHLISGGDTGGAKTHVLSLVKGLGRYVQAKLVCFIEDEFYREGKQLGIDIEVIEQKKRYDISVTRKLADKILKEGYDIIHCHGARANFIAMLLKPKIKKPFVTTIHSDYRLDFKDNLYKRFVYTTINAVALRRFDYYIAVSSNFKKMLVKRGFDSRKIFTVYNGIDLEGNIEITPREEFLSRYGIDAPGKMIVGIAGRLDSVKDHETFIRAAHQVLKQRDDVIFLVAGTGSEQERLISLAQTLGIRDKVYFLGFVKDPYSFFNAIDVNVLTSRSESFPYVILEGARLKKAVISTNVGGIADLVKPGINGYLFNVGDKDALAGYMNSMLRDKTRTKEMGERLYNDVKENFSLEKMTLDHYQIYATISQNRR